MQDAPAGDLGLQVLPSQYPALSHSRSREHGMPSWAGGLQVGGTAEKSQNRLACGSQGTREQLSPSLPGPRQTPGGPALVSQKSPRAGFLSHVPEASGRTPDRHGSPRPGSALQVALTGSQ